MGKIKNSTKKIRRIISLWQGLVIIITGYKIIISFYYAAVEYGNSKKWEERMRKKL